MGEVCSTYGGEATYRILEGKPGRNRPIWTRRRRWEIRHTWSRRVALFSLTLDSRQRLEVSFTPRPRNSRQRKFNTHWMGGWLGLRDGLDVGEHKSVVPAGNQTPDRSVHSLFTAPSIWKDNIKVTLNELPVNRIYVVQDREKWRAVVNTVMNIWVPQNVGNSLSSSGFSSFSRNSP